LGSAGAELVRAGSNVVFRLAAAPVIARVTPRGVAAGEAERGVRVARWLEEQDFPATRLVAGVEQPQRVGGGWVVTFWESAQDAEEYASVAELAALLRQLHALKVPEDLGLPRFEPFAKVAAGLRDLACVEPEDRTFLEERAAGLQQAYAQLEFALPFGLVHGDANVGNALRDRTGQPILIDLDGFALAPREWDLVLTALYYERFGWHTRAEYESFVAAYGFDLLGWSGYPVLADLRELMMTVWLGGRVANGRSAAREFALRVETLRVDGDRRGWRPF
jgi:aminoglycoside phosphotransferase (APT) family kinase protein